MREKLFFSIIQTRNLIKRAEHWRTDAFELWRWKWLLRVPLTTRRSNQSILKEINWIFIGRTDAEAEAPVLWPDAKNLWKRPWCWERMKARGEGDDRGWDGWWHHWLNGHESEQIPGDSEGQGSLACCSPWGHSQTWLSNWTTTKPISVKHKQTMSFFLNVACDSASPCL